MGESLTLDKNCKRNSVQNFAFICKLKSEDSRQNRIKDKIYEEMSNRESARSDDYDKSTLMRAANSDTTQLLRAITADKLADDNVAELLRPNDREAETHGIDIPVKTR